MNKVIIKSIPIRHHSYYQWLILGLQQIEQQKYLLQKAQHNLKPKSMTIGEKALLKKHMKQTANFINDSYSDDETLSESSLTGKHTKQPTSKELEDSNMKVEI